MIDVHVLTHSGTRPEWLAECLASLDCQPCTVHVVTGVEGNIAAGRAAGFALGAHPYVTYVDSDDFVLPGAMQAVIDALDGGLDAVVTGEVQLRGDALSKPYFGHHLFAMRRDIIQPHLADYVKKFRSIDCVTAMGRIAKPVHIDVIAYVWRMHPDQSHKTPGCYK